MVLEASIGDNAMLCIFQEVSVRGQFSRENPAEPLGFAGRFGRTLSSRLDLVAKPRAGKEFSVLQTPYPQSASKGSMLAGKRCGPTLIYLFIAIIVGTLLFVAMRHGPRQQPRAVPIHDKQ